MSAAYAAQRPASVVPSAAAAAAAGGAAGGGQSADPVGGVPERSPANAARSGAGDGAGGGLSGRARRHARQHHRRRGGHAAGAGDLVAGRPAIHENAAQGRRRSATTSSQAGAAREGAKVAGLLMKQINFPTFVAGADRGCLSRHRRVVDRADGGLYRDDRSVAKSLKQFTDDNVSANQGRDHMVEKFPDLFEIGQDDFGDSRRARLKLREGVDESEAMQARQLDAVRRRQRHEVDGSLDENVEKALVMAARMQLAKQRQQLMASMVLMGINRIVVTDGKISAKIMYDFKATDTMKKKRSATAIGLCPQRRWQPADDLCRRRQL